MNKLQCPVVKSFKDSEFAQEEGKFMQAAELYRSFYKMTLDEALIKLSANKSYPDKARKFYAKLAAQVKF